MAFAQELEASLWNDSVDLDALYLDPGLVVDATTPTKPSYCAVSATKCTKVAVNGTEKITSGFNYFWNRDSATTTETRKYTCYSASGQLTFKVVKVVDGQVQGDVRGCTSFTTVDKLMQCQWTRYQQYMAKYQKGYVWYDANGRKSSDWQPYVPASFTEPVVDGAPVKVPGSTMTNSGDPCTKPGT